jgi:hypothetical protein
MIESAPYKNSITLIAVAIWAELAPKAFRAESTTPIEAAVPVIDATEPARIGARRSLATD